MKKNSLWNLLAILMAATMSVGLQSCFLFGGDDDDPVLSVNKTSISLNASGDGDKDIAVTAEHTDWTATVTNGSPWLRVRVNKNGQLASISVDANNTTQARKGTVRIAATEDANLAYDIEVSQAGADGVLKVNTSSVEFEPEGGQQTIQVESNSDWNASSSQGWLIIDPTSVSAPSSGSETKTVTLIATENTTNAARQCTIDIKTKDGKGSATVIVSQKKPNPVIQVNGTSSGSVEFPGAFDNGKSGIDYKQTFKIKSNVQWTLSGKPDWLNISPTSGNGEVDLTIYPTNENISPRDREVTLVLSGDGTSATISIIQRGSQHNGRVTPANSVALWNQIGWELSATGSVDKYRMIVVTDAVYNRKTEKELLEDLRMDDAEKFADEPLFFYAYDSYGNSIRANTTYYICTVAYDKKDNEGEVVTTKITTPAYVDYNNDAYIGFTEATYNSTRFSFTASKEGFCNTYHLIYGNVPSAFVNYNSVLYAFQINYYIKNKRKHWLAEGYELEIVTDYPNNHTFNHYYTTSLFTRPVLVAYGWGVFSDGRLSSDLIGFSYDTSSDDSRQLKASRSRIKSKKNLVLKRSVETARARKTKK